MPKLPSMLLAGVCLFAGGSGAMAVGAMGGLKADNQLREKLAIRLPNTEITAVDCDTVDGLCEVQAGANIVYVDRSARHLVVGRVYDMETNQDLTAARLLKINPGSLVAGGASAEGAAPSQPSVAIAKTVDLEGLPANGAISFGRGRDTVTVFSDFRCGYCKKLYEELIDMNVRVIERPISIMGSRALSENVLCAADQKAAVRAAYEGRSVNGSAECDTSGLDANEAFAKENGFTGTPVLVREDGAVLQGYRDARTIRQWLREGRGS